MLRLVRPIIAKIDGSGQIIQIEGGYGGFLGLDPSGLENTSVFDHLDAVEGDRLAHYFIQNADMSVDSMTVPMPFRIELLGADATPHPVDIIPTAYEEDGVTTGWIVVAIPIANTTALSRALDAEMAGAPRGEVRRLLAGELVTDGTGWILVDLPTEAPVVATPCDDSLSALAEQVRSDIDAGWEPWHDAIEHPAVPIDFDQLPNATRTALEEGEFTRIAVAPVSANGAVIAMYVHLAQQSAYTDSSEIKINVIDRIMKLVDITSLVMTRWRDQDELTALARSDSLTGLANRQSFSDALAEPRSESALIYVDVDSFKHVNDTLGHEAGDRVLREVADRIVAACRPTDVVARLGGDEFAVILNNVDMDTARLIGNRIVESVRLPMAGIDCRQVTVSAGLESLDAETESVDDADQAMLRAKRTGRDQLIIA